MDGKLFRTHSRPSFWGALLVIAALCGLYAPPSLAVALYSGSATAELTITDIAGASGVPCSICTDASGDTLFFGNASAISTGVANIVAVDPLNLATGDKVSLTAETSGSASPDGLATGFFDAFTRIDLSNPELTSITVTFRLAWTLFAEASIASPFEDAATFAEIFVRTSAGRLLDEAVDSDALFGPFGPQSLSDDFTFSLTLGAGETGFVSIDVYTEGFASAFAAPEPGALPLLALGLAGLGFFARRRRYA